MARPSRKVNTDPPTPLEGAAAPDVDSAAQQTARQHESARKGAETRKRNRKIEEKNQDTKMQNALLLLVLGCRRLEQLTKSTSQEPLEPPAEQERTEAKKPKRMPKSQGSAPRTKNKRGGESERNRPRSLLNHDHNDESDDSPLADSVRQPLAPKTVIKNAARPSQASKKSRSASDNNENDEDDLQDWQSDEGPDGRHHTDSGASNDEGAGDSYKADSDPESDGGRINRKLEIPKWTKGKASAKSEDSNRADHHNFNDGGSRALVVNSDDEDLLIPYDGIRSQHNSTASLVSMQTTSSTGPPLTAASASDRDEVQLSDAESVELPSRIGNLPAGPIPGISSQEGQGARGRQQSKKEKSQRQLAAEAEVSANMLIRASSNNFFATHSILASSMNLIPVVVVPAATMMPLTTMSVALAVMARTLLVDTAAETRIGKKIINVVTAMLKMTAATTIAILRTEIVVIVGTLKTKDRHRRYDREDEGRRRRQDSENDNRGHRRQDREDEERPLRRRDDSNEDRHRSSRRLMRRYYDDSDFDTDPDCDFCRQYYEEDSDSDEDSDTGSGKDYSRNQGSSRRRRSSTHSAASSAIGHLAASEICPRMSPQELEWPEAIRIILTPRGKVNKKDQTPTMQNLFASSIIALGLDLACDHGIYKADLRMQEQCKIIIKLAEPMNIPRLTERLQNDAKFTLHIVNLADGRNGSLRGNLKKAASGLVPQQYGLGQDDTAARVAALLLSSQYIYPGNILGPPTQMKYRDPFYLDIFPQLIATHFFNGPTSIGTIAQNQGKLTSSIREKPHELEIPAPMLGVVSAMIALALSDWSTGTYAGPRDVNIALAEDYYSKIMVEIAKMKENTLMYHRVMHGIYRRVW
ncbi:hypothetical protein NM688_g743 [Phlebia brevispora]|uniref:Uncharacterized protein n=1 Tax=Phlebia brevispora TaxID=194682 RepID=A0ACC1TDP8_9APHY|nr:hypothetical protein NM688_g743 [Phlebia brevispora]